MHEYYIKTMGGTITYVDDRATAEAIARDVAAGKNITIRGKFIPNHQITDADWLAQPKETFSQLAASIFDEKRGVGFWETIFIRNMSRKAGEPFFQNAVVEWAKSESGYTSPQDVLDFLEAHWDQAEPHNKATTVKKRDLESLHLQREFLATDQGREYAAKFPR